MEKILKAMMGMAWERAKGELESIAQASYPPSAGGPCERRAWEVHCQRRREVIEAFIKTMEEDELYL